MARIVYAHAVIPPGERKKGVAAPAKARSSGPGAPVTAQRRRASRAMPKTGPKAPLVRHVTVPMVTRTILPMTVRQLEEELRRVGRPATAAMLARQTGDIVAETTRYVPGWLIRWDDVAVSQNVLMRKYANHHAYERLVETWTGIFRISICDGRIPKAKGRRRLEVVRYVRSKGYLLDRGNVSGGFKPYLDAAVRAGLIRNDREEDVDDIYRQAIDTDERVEITVSDL